MTTKYFNMIKYFILKEKINQYFFTCQRRMTRGDLNYIKQFLDQLFDYFYYNNLFIVNNYICLTNNKKLICETMLRKDARDFKS